MHNACVRSCYGEQCAFATGAAGSYPRYPFKPISANLARILRIILSTMCLLPGFLYLLAKTNASTPLGLTPSSMPSSRAPPPFINIVDF